MLLRNRNWDTRIAAGQAIEAVCRHVPQWAPSGGDGAAMAVDDSGAPADLAEDGRFSFATFDMAQVLQCAAPLLGSSGSEYDIDPELFELDPKERLRQQRKNLAKQLGLTRESGDVEGMFDAADLDAAVQAGRNKRKRTADDDDEAERRAKEIKLDLSGLSARERNRALRMAKKQKRDVNREFRESGTIRAPAKESMARAATVTDQGDDQKVVVESRVDTNELFASADEWPFAARCEELCNDLFHPQWEIRHGAAVGLREIIKLHGAGAGRQADASPEAQDGLNQRWLEDMAIRLLCVCALDHFGDYVSDQVVAPVRDTAAQALGAVLKHLDVATTTTVLRVLLRLQDEPKWEVRHGGLLVSGLSYFFFVSHTLMSLVCRALNIWWRCAWTLCPSCSRRCCRSSTGAWQTRTTTCAPPPPRPCCRLPRLWWRRRATSCLASCKCSGRRCLISTI